MRSRHSEAVALLALATLVACSGTPAPTGARSPDAQAARSARPPVPVGEVTRDEIEAQVDKRWSAAYDAARMLLDSAAVERLAAAPEGAELTVIFGTWCGDSRREVTRFWRALDEAPGEMPFATRLIAVDRAKEEPADMLAGLDLRYVPTFIVRRDGREVGRVVETAVGSIEADLADLLDGSAEGVLSESRPELRITTDGER